MCDNQNLIDLTSWDEPKQDETAIEEAQGESAIIESTSFKGPYDPFDSMEREACIKVSLYAHTWTGTCSCYSISLNV